MCFAIRTFQQLKVLACMASEISYRAQRLIQSYTESLPFMCGTSQLLKPKELKLIDQYSLGLHT